jgi:hypothetical protein
MDPQIRIRIHTKMSWTRNTAWHCGLVLHRSMAFFFVFYVFLDPDPPPSAFDQRFVWGGKAIFLGSEYGQIHSVLLSV